VLIDYMNGATTGGMYSDGVCTAWSHPPSVHMFLKYHLAVLVGRADLTDGMCRMTKVLAMARAVAESVYAERRRDLGIAV